MERSVSFSAAYDTEKHGMHGVHIYFTVKNAEGGLTFSVSTNWYLPQTQKRIDSRPPPSYNPWMFHKPMAFGVDIHLHKPKNEYSYCHENCTVTGGICYSDGSALLGESFLETLISGGDNALFERMEKQFEDWK